MTYPRAWQWNTYFHHDSRLHECDTCRDCYISRNPDLVEGIAVQVTDYFTSEKLDEMGLVGLYRRDQMIEFDVFPYPDEGLADYTTPTL